MFFWISLILDVAVGLGLWCHDKPVLFIVSVLGGLVTSELVARWSFHLFFHDRHDYGEAWKYSWKPDLFSWIDGELMDDWWASWKLGAYHSLVVMSGISVFNLLDYWLGE